MQLDRIGNAQITPASVLASYPGPFPYSAWKRASMGTRLPRFMQILKHKLNCAWRRSLAYISPPSSWILKALECIGQCVEVDPNKRPGAKETRVSIFGSFINVPSVA